MTAPIPRDMPDLPAVPGVPSLFPSPVPAAAVVAPVRRPLAAAFRVLVASTVATGIAVYLLLGDPLRVLSYFTVQANVLLALVMLASARRAWSARRPLSGGVSGAALLYIVATSLVYHLLLEPGASGFGMTGAVGTSATPGAAGTSGATGAVGVAGVVGQPQATGWATAANILLHTVTPILALLDWLLFTTPGRLHLRQTAPWLLYPLAYLAFSLGRGELLLPGTAGRYLYPFLNVDQHGYRGVLANALLLGLALFAAAVVLVALDHIRPNPVRHRAKTGFRLQPPVG
ncbi:Pr6Pr family membrane protein [Streptomyces sp. NPDC048290]|uniref:Pr6Pr family membrane protein n=1 Tax=Streptomyces sp. NPDC048290 TaxID=3155811 RepID=UPI00344A8EF7